MEQGLFGLAAVLVGALASTVTQLVIARFNRREARWQRERAALVEFIHATQDAHRRHGHLDSQDERLKLSLARETASMHL